MAAAASLALLCAIAGIILFMQSHQPVITAATAVPVPAVPEPTVAPAAMAENDPVLELFNPSQAALDQQLSEASLKNRLEDLVVLTFVLRRCQFLSAAEYSESFQAYARYAQSSPGALEAAIASATASYGLLYARSECNAPSLSANAAQLAQWRRQILNPPTQ